MEGPHDITLDYWPGGSEKHPSKPVRTRCLVNRHVHDRLLDLLLSETVIKEDIGNRWEV